MKTATHDITAIPTVYNGVQLKSRMESKCAYLFDKLRWKWEYEPVSVMLDGVNYTPDFYIPERQYLIECRGYDSELGQRQIDAAVRAVESGTVGGLPVRSYIVIGPEDTRMCRADNWELGFKVGLCIGCDSWIAHPSDCACEDATVNDFCDIGSTRGQVTFNNQPPETWEPLPWDTRSTAITEMVRVSKIVLRVFEASGWFALWHPCWIYLDQIEFNPKSILKYSLRLPFTETSIEGRMMAAALTLAICDPSIITWLEEK